MGLIERLFSKQAKKLSEEEQTVIPAAYIMIGTDRDGEDFIECNAEEGREEDLAKLLFLLHSGMLLEVSLDAIRTFVGDEKSDTIADNAYNMLMEHFGKAKKEKEVNNQISGPVIDPLSVFSIGEPDEPDE